MARSWQYPRWRRIVMQMTMWAILGATVGLAALVSHEKRRMLRVELGPAMVENDLSVRLPAGWQPSASTGQGSLVVVEAKEPAEQSGRVLTIFRQRTAVLLSPLEYLLQSGLLPPAYLAPRLSAAGKLVSPDPAQVAEAPGILLGYSRRVRRPDGYLELKELYACAVLPSRQAVIVRLEGVGRPAPADEQLVRQVAESIRIERPLVPERVDEIDLHGGMRLKPPNGFLLVPEKDPNRIDRHLLRDASAGSWGTIDLVPCVFFLDERPESVRAMLSLRGTDWQKATVKEDGPRRWRIDKPAGVEAAFPSRAYLLVNTDGQALLVVMHGGYQDDGWFDAAWQEIADGVGFTASARLAALLKAGAEEAQRLEDQGLAKLLGNDREEQWWLLYSETPTHHIGWTHLWYDKQGAWSAVRETRRHDPGEAITRVIQEWDGSADLGRYGAVMAYSASSGEADEPFVAKYKQATVLEDGTLTTAPPRWSQPAPQQYVPGGWLPLLIGQLRPRSMIVRSESFLGYEEHASRDLLTVIIEPEADPARTSEGAAAKRRCVTVQVNGSGQLSRWYFQADGTLENIDLADGLRRVRTEAHELRGSFGSDGRMLPLP